MADVPGKTGGGPSSDPRIALETLLWLSEEAFEGDASNSLLSSVRELREDDWSALPSDGHRSIGAILEHVGWAKWMYEDYAFGRASLRGDQPPLIPTGGADARPHDDLLAWLREGHRRWIASVRMLASDAELERERLANWGERLPTRTLIAILLAHDYYHAGEINHLRALLQGTDRWPYDGETQRPA